ncbi:MAG: GAF domain-containing protein [Bacteroidales bacterium]
MNPGKKNGRYKRIYTQLQVLLNEIPWPAAKQSTIAAVLHHKLDHYFWTGFYLLTEGKLIVGPYQGPVACIELKKNTGVCWAAINQGNTIVVPDVHRFPGHIACDPRSASEIVVPLKNTNGIITGVLDVDSNVSNAFDDTDARWLEKIIQLI